MSFTYVLTTTIGKLRLLIHDTVAGTAHFSDEELQVFIDLTASLFAAAVLSLESWVASMIGNETSERIGDYAYTKAEVENMMALIEKYKKMDTETPAFAWAEMNFTDIEETE